MQSTRKQNVKLWLNNMQREMKLLLRMNECQSRLNFMLEYQVENGALQVTVGDKTNIFIDLMSQYFYMLQ